ncbi:hypothetical protein J3F83DRAFT_327906 [Trichoderma novae-zelandiae]
MPDAGYSRRSSASTTAAAINSAAVNSAGRDGLRQQVSNYASTATGMRFIATFDTYEPGTEMQRLYQRSIQCLKDYDSQETPKDISQLPIRERQQLPFKERESQWSNTDAPGEWLDEINAEFEDMIDQAWAKAEEDALAIQEDNRNTKK